MPYIMANDSSTIVKRPRRDVKSACYSLALLAQTGEMKVGAELLLIEREGEDEGMEGEQVGKN